MAPNFWMVRAGEGGYLFEEFEQAGVVGIGWTGAGDFTDIRSVDQMKDRLRKTLGEDRPAALGNSAAMAFKFRHTMSPGDSVVTYDPSSRQYLLGEVTGDYEYDPDRIPDYNHVRPVQWLGKVDRDDLSTTSKNTLGSVLTIFEPGDTVLDELQRALRGEDPIEAVEGEPEQDLDFIREDLVEKAHEFVKDRILSLSPEDLERLVAGVLRAIGYQARVTPKGPDRGRDVIASPDGLGLQQPRIMAEVKHRQASSGADMIRSFAGALRPADRGLFVSTGGFTREARYEAERASIPITLVDLDELARLVTEHYEKFDTNARALIPLVRIYWPSS